MKPEILETLLRYAEIGERYQRAMSELLAGEPITVGPTFAEWVRENYVTKVKYTNPDLTRD